MKCAFRWAKAGPPKSYRIIPTSNSSYYMDYSTKEDGTIYRAQLFQRKLTEIFLLHLPHGLPSNHSLRLQLKQESRNTNAIWWIKTSNPLTRIQFRGIHYHTRASSLSLWLLSLLRFITFYREHKYYLVLKYYLTHGNRKLVVLFALKIVKTL